MPPFFNASNGFSFSLFPDLINLSSSPLVSIAQKCDAKKKARFALIFRSFLSKKQERIVNLIFGNSDKMTLKQMISLFRRS